MQGGCGNIGGRDNGKENGSYYSESEGDCKGHRLVFAYW